MEGGTDRVPRPVVNDTGSERTLMRPDVVIHRQVPTMSHRLCGVTGDCTEHRNPLDVKLQLVGREESFVVYMT